MRRINTTMLQLHSTHSTWLFDTEAKCFKRVPTGVDPEAPLAAAPWEPYVELKFDGDEMTVVLDGEGTLLLRAQVSTAPGASGEPTQELRLQLD